MLVRQFEIRRSFEMKKLGLVLISVGGETRSLRSYGIHTPGLAPWKPET